jgi:hypothetical protein
MARYNETIVQWRSKMT